MKKINNIHDFFRANDEINETSEAMGQFIIDEIKKNFIGTIFKYDDYVFEVSKIISVCPSDSVNGIYDNAVEAHLMGTGYIFVDDSHAMKVDIEQYAFKHISFRISPDGIYPCSYPSIITPEKCRHLLVLHGASENIIQDFDKKHA